MTRGWPASLRYGWSASLRQGWPASLRLDVAWDGQSTTPTHREHSGPLRLQKLLYPEGPKRCHAIVLHPPGGVVGGDSLAITINAATQSQLLLTTPGAAKWYRSPDQASLQTIQLRVAARACLEWLPQEAIVFDQANTDWHTQIDLADETAAMMACEVVMLGRAARGEQFKNGRLSNRITITRAGQLLYQEQWTLLGGDARLHNPQGLGAHPCFGQLLAIASLAQLQQARTLLQDTLLTPQLGVAPQLGASLLPQGVLIIRAIGAGPETVRNQLEQCWRMIRQIIVGGDATAPRIWST